MMEAHVDRFTGRVADYERYRLRFPDEVLRVLEQRCGLRRKDVVADVGAGTGMLAEIFLEHGNRVIAVEPNAEMLAACEGLCARFSGLSVVAATAENTGLQAASIDMVAVGRAFHWFDQERALAEFKRVLKPQGWVVLVSNRRAQEGSEQAREYEAILMDHGRDYAALRGGYRGWEGMKPYGAAETFTRKIPGDERLTMEEFLGQTQSLSVTPMPGEEKHEGMQRALREFFARWSVDGVMRLETSCEVVGWRVA